MSPQIPAATLLRSLIVGRLLQHESFHAVESLVCSPARQALGVRRTFGDDVLGYFTERLDVKKLREAIVGIVRRAKRNKAFQESRWIGIALDGTGAGRSRDKQCPECRPVKNDDDKIVGYHHCVVMASVVGTTLSIPMDVEPYGPGDSEYSAGQRLLRRVNGNLGSRFCDYVVVDGKFATAPFLHTVGETGLRVVARLKQNLPELYDAAKQRFRRRPAQQTFRNGADRVEIWDADDFDPWENLDWDTVRVIRYLQHKPNGEVVEAYWLTDWPKSKAGSQALYYMAKSRWEIENQGFNDAKNRYGFEHICHHHSHSILIVWLIIVLTMTLERLYRNRYLHRGFHSVLESAQLLLLLQISLGRQLDSS